MNVELPSGRSDLALLWDLRVSPDGWVRLETGYVMSLRQSSWNYGARWQRRLGGGPFFAGLDLELKSWELRRHGQLSHGTLGVLFGTTYERR